MSQYILINRIKVQNANAIAGFTWGFPAITHFLGFSHNLARKLAVTESFNDIGLTGCAVVAHNHQAHTYRPSYDFEFTQSRNPPYLSSINNDKKSDPPPIVEEGKMNMTVSLLIAYKGNIGNRKNSFHNWLKKTCILQRLAGGTILDIGSIEACSVDDESGVRAIKRKLLPGFVLRDRSAYLEEHYQAVQQQNPDAELLDAWLDFAALKQKARPKSNEISKHLKGLVESKPDNQLYNQLLDIWDTHLKTPYQESNVPDELKNYFCALKVYKASEKLLSEWQSYCAPTAQTDADWEYNSKPEKGYLVPIMTGYKAISEVYDNKDVENTRDNETDVCFVESVHSVGEWRSVHRLKSSEDLRNCLWHYHYEDNWYLCKQGQAELAIDASNQDMTSENPDDDFS